MKDLTLESRYDLGFTDRCRTPRKAMRMRTRRQSATIKETLAHVLSSGKIREVIRQYFVTMATQTTTLTASDPPSLFHTAPFIPADAIFALTAQYNADSFPRKVNLGQGAYRDENAQPWILPSVQKARELLAKDNLNHEYLPILGHAGFRTAAPRTALGLDLFGRVENRVYFIS